MAKHEETRLISVPGAPEAPGRTLAKRQERKVVKAAASVPRTTTGESAADIIAAWVGWHHRGSGVPVPQSVIDRIGKQVKSLITTGYTTDEIKHGLSIWTVVQMDNDMLSPTMLDRFVWRFARDTRSGAAAWRDTVRKQVAAFSQGGYGGVSGPASKAETRRARSLQAIQEWTES